MNNDNKPYTRIEVLIQIKKILRKAISRVLIVVLIIEDLEELQIYETKASTSVRVACAVNFLGLHSELVDEITAIENLQLIDYKKQDRYGIIRDNEELFIALIGEKEDSLLISYTTDRNQVLILSQLITQCWISGTLI